MDFRILHDYSRRDGQAKSVVPPEGTTLESLIKGTRGRDATDQRDHVYALLGLISDSKHEPFEPDYSKLPSWAYQNAVISVCKSRKDLTFLIYASGKDTGLKPSWCVDFSDKTWAKDSLDQKWIEAFLYKANRVTPMITAQTAHNNMSIEHDPDRGALK